MTPEELRRQLTESGHRTDTSTPGLVAWSGEFEAVLDGVRRLWLSDAPPVSRHTFPPLLGEADFLRTGYLRSFPHLSGEVHVFTGGDADHKALLGDLDAGRDWHERLAPAGMALIPASCEQVYPLWSGDHAAPSVKAATSWCFRHEPSDDPLRLVCFRIAEYVHVGTEESAGEFYHAWAERLKDFFTSLGLRVAPGVAHDPFFGRIGRLMAQRQLTEGGKIEVRCQIYDEHPTSLGSSNYHASHFAHAFGISLQGQPAHTACAGFGIERVTIALFATHGMATTQWPADIKEKIGL